MKRQFYLLLITCLFGYWGATPLYAQIGLLSIDGDLTLTSSGTYEAELKDLTGEGTGHDHVAVDGDLALDGTLDILESGYSATIGDAFNLMAFTGSLTGTFSAINWPADMIAQGWSIDYGILFPGTVTIYEASALLPVELSYFTGEQRDGLHWLNWETQTETDNNYFGVEYSKDGTAFFTIGEVEGQGDGQEVQAYSFTHKPASAGNYFYRLRQVDFDGTYEYSNVISLFSDQEGIRLFYPNPTNGEISFQEAVPGLLVYDLRGKEVLTVKQQAMVFDLSSLPNGVFFVKVYGNSTPAEKIIVNK